MSNNPYESSQEYGSEAAYAPPSREKPASVMVFGILNLIFGALGICGIGGSLISFAMPTDPNLPNPALELMRNNPAYMGFTYFTLALGFVFVVVVIAGGVGLLQGRKYGRSLSIAYGWYAVASAIIGTIANYFFLFRPLMAQAQNAGGPAAQGAMIGVFAGVVGGCIGLIYPVLLLIFMNRQNVREALR